MQASNEALISKNDLKNKVSTSIPNFKFNIKRDSTHGNHFISLYTGHADSLKSSIDNSKFYDDDDRRNDVESDVDASRENTDVLVALENSLHPCSSRESKQSDDSIQSTLHLKHEVEVALDKEVKESQENKTKSEFNKAESSKKITPCPILMRRKSCLSVRTLEDSLSKGSSSNISNDSEFSVSFSKLQIREYELQLVNNPSCGGGPPIGIGNKFTELEDIHLKDVTDKEKNYVKIAGKPPGPYDKLYIKPHDRLEMVVRCGYTDREIVACMLETKELQKQRNQSATASDKEEKKKEKVNKVTKKLKKLCRSREQKKHDKIVKSFCNIRS